MKRITQVAAVFCMAAMFVLAAPAASTPAVKAQSLGLSCKVLQMAFSTSYTVSAKRRCTARGKVLNLAGKWVWTVKVGDYGGYYGPFGPSAGKGSAFTLPVTKVTRGVLRGFNPPGWVEVVFTFSGTWKGKPFKAIGKAHWASQTTHLIGIGAPPKLTASKDSGGPVDCSPANQTADGGVIKELEIHCSGGDGKCSWVPQSDHNGIQGTYYVVNAQMIRCTNAGRTENSSTNIKAIFYTSTSPVVFGCAGVWGGISSFAIPPAWGGGTLQATVQVTSYSANKNEEWDQHLQLTGPSSPCDDLK